MISSANSVQLTPPHSWREVPFWSLFRRVKEINHPDEELLSVYRDHGVVPTASRDDNFNKPSLDLSGYQLVRKGALVTNKMKAWQGSIAISRHRGIVSPAYYVYEPLSREHDQYLHYLLRSQPFVALYQRISKGVRVNQWDLEHEALRIVPIPLPDLPTQKAIADFLDRETARIDQLIEKKQRMVGGLEEKNRATTKWIAFGQDKSCAKKANRFSWLPDLPEHWDILRTAHLFQNLDSERVPLSEVERADLEKKYPYYGASGQIDFVDRYIFDEDHILVGEDGANLILQSTPIAFIARGKYWVNNHAHILKPKDCLLEFWTHMLNQVPYGSFVSGSAQPKLTGEALGNIVLPVPPLEERKAIADKIESQIKESAKVQPQIKASIDLLREFRSALITAAVTGQIDVSTWSNQGTSDRRLDQIEEATSA